MRNRKHRRIATIGIVGALALAIVGIAGWSYGGRGASFGWMGGCWNDSRYGSSSPGTVIGDADVAAIAERYIAAYQLEDLAIEEVMAFDNHYYVEVEEPSSGRYAFEFLIDRNTGIATPEPGPNMMWNLKYGHMAQGMMGLGGVFNTFGNDGTSMTLSEDDAYEAAALYLSRLGSGLEADQHTAAYYGYYTLHTLQEGQIVGMLSVNGFSGEVWSHTWHGAYLGQVGSETN